MINKNELEEDDISKSDQQHNLPVTGFVLKPNKLSRSDNQPACQNETSTLLSGDTTESSSSSSSGSSNSDSASGSSSSSGGCTSSIEGTLRQTSSGATITTSQSSSSSASIRAMRQMSNFSGPVSTCRTEDEDEDDDETPVGVAVPIEAPQREPLDARTSSPSCPSARQQLQVLNNNNNNNQRQSQQSEKIAGIDVNQISANRGAGSRARPLKLIEVDSNNDNEKSAAEVCRPVLLAVDSDIADGSHVMMKGSSRVGAPETNSCDITKSDSTSGRVVVTTAVHMNHERRIVTGGEEEEEEEEEEVDGENENEDGRVPKMEATGSSAKNDNERNGGSGGGGTSSDSERRYRPQKYCAVCGDKAIACNFNAVTCESCKAFFRRNAFKEQRLRCLFENRCVIDRVTRRFCSKCRLLKCLQIGMKREWILTDEQKQIKRVKIMQNKQTRQQQQQQQVSTTNVAMAPIKCSPEQSTDSSPSSGRSNSQVGNQQAYQNQTEPRSPALQHHHHHHKQQQHSLLGRRQLIETRDASTSCPDEADLLSGHILPYCTMAHQCQFCSFKLIPAPNQQQATATALPTGISHNHNLYQHPPNFSHHQQQFQNQQPLNHAHNHNHNHHHHHHHQQQQQHQHQHEQQPQQQPRPPHNQPQHPSHHHYHYQQAGLQTAGGSSFYSQQNQQLPNMAPASSAAALGNRYNFGHPSGTPGQLVVQRNGSGEPAVAGPHHHHHHHHQYLYHHPSSTSRSGDVISNPNSVSSTPTTAGVHQHLDCCCSSSSSHVQPPSQLLRGPPFLNTTGNSAAAAAASSQTAGTGGQLAFPVDSMGATSGAQNSLAGGGCVTPTSAAPLAASNYTTAQTAAAAAAAAASVPHLNMIEFLQARVQPLNDSPSHNNGDATGAGDYGRIEVLQQTETQQQQQQQQVCTNNQQVGSVVNAVPAGDQSHMIPIPGVEDKGMLAAVNFRGGCGAVNGDAVNDDATAVCQVPMEQQQAEGDGSQDGQVKLLTGVPVEQLEDTATTTITTTTNTTASGASCAAISVGGGSSNRADKFDCACNKTSISERAIGSSGSNGTEGEQGETLDTTPMPTTSGRCADLCEAYGHQQQASASNHCVAQSATRWNPKTNYVTWKGELFVQPAASESDVQVRVEKLEFSDSERRNIYEMLEATRFLFEHNEKQKNDSSLDDIVFFCDLSLRRLIKTVKKINAFRMLSMDDQIMLLKNACFKILLIRSSVNYDDESEGWIGRNGCKVPLKCMKTEKCHNYERHKELLEKLVPPLRRDRLVMAFLVLIILFDPTITLKHTNSVGLDNIVYLCTLRKYLLSTQPEPLAKYERLVEVLQLVNACNEEYNLFFSRKYQPEQITPLLIEIFDISVNQPTR